MVDPKRIETEWNKRCRIGGFGRWRELTSDTRRMLREFVEACHEPAELTEEDAGRCWDENLEPDDFSWAQLTDDERRSQTQYANTLRRYTPPSLPTKLARAIEALGPDHPEAVRILQEAADDDG